ncbi:MAG: aminotransferase class V-fold PLP-dependent enzyme, partial [Ilumatobacter sp.]
MTGSQVPTSGGGERNDIDSVERLAEHFVEHDRTYLLSHSIGLPVVGSREVAARYFDTWEHHTADAWPRWLEGIEGFRSTLARLLGADATAICPQSNVSSGLTKLLDSVRHEFDTPTVLISENAFPSLGFVCERSGYRVRFVPETADVCDPEVWREHLRGVDVAIITHVHSNTGVCVPVPDIAPAGRDAGALLVVDVAQSVGVVPIDLVAWERSGVDAVVGSCVKWPSGGPGAGWLWVSEPLLPRCRPTDVGWFSHAAPFEFDIHDYRDAPDALRFWGGSPTVLPFLVAAHSLATIDSIGVGTIRAHNLALTDHLVEMLGERVTSPHDRARRSGTAIVRADVAEVDRLASHGIDVDHRANGIRVSPHVHTTRR